MSDPVIPNVPASLPSDQAVFFKALKTSIEYLMGQGRTPDQERALRVKELESLGIDTSKFLSSTSAKPYSLNEPTSTTGEIPDPPSNLVVTKGAFVHRLTWTNPTDPIVWYIEIWVADNSQSRGDAELVGIYTIIDGIRGKTGSYNHSGFNLTHDQTYWIRSKSYGYRHSVWEPPDSQGGYVVPGDDSVQETVSKVLEILQGNITENHLYQDLSSRIDLIDAPDIGLLDRVDFVEVTIDAPDVGLLDRVSFVESTIDDIPDITEIEAMVDALNMDTGVPFDSDSTYSVDDVVRYDAGAGTKLYICIQEITTTPAPIPTNELYWTKIGESVSLAGNILANTTGISNLDTRITTNEGSITSQATDITQLQSDLTTVSGDVSSHTGALSSLDTRVTENEGNITSQGTAITQLQSDLLIESDNISANSAAVSNLNTRVTANEGDISAQANAITQVQSDLTAAEGDISINAGALSNLDTRVTNNEGDISSQATAITQIQSDIESAESDILVNAGALSSLDTRVTENEGDITSQATAITQLQSDLATESGNITANATALFNLDTRVTSNEGDLSSQATAITQIQADLTTAEGDISANTGALSSLDTRVTENEGEIAAQSTALTQLVSDLEYGPVAVNTTAINSLDARVTAHDGDIDSQAMAITQLQSELLTESGNISANASALSSLDTRVTSNEGTIISQAGLISDLRADVDNNSSSLTTEQTARADADSSLATSITTGVATAKSYTETWAVPSYNPHFEQGIEHWDAANSSAITGRGSWGGTVLSTITDSYNASTVFIPVDVNRTYVGRVRVRQTGDPISGGNNFYAGLKPYDKDKEYIPPEPGAAGTYLYFVARQKPLTVTGGWQIFEGKITGEGLTHANFRSGTAYIKLVFLGNHDNGNGTYEIDGFEFCEDIAASHGIEDGADVTETSAAFQAEQTARADGDSANASSITQLQSDLSTEAGNISANTTAINSLDTRVTSNEGDITSQAGTITQIQADLISITGDISANTGALSSMDTRVTANEAGIDAQAAALTQLVTDLENGDIDVDSTIIQNLDTRVTENEGDIASHATAITQLQTDLSTESGNISANATAVSNLDTRVTANEGDITSQSGLISGLQAAVNNNAATITTEEIARTNADNSLASSITSAIATAQAYTEGWSENGADVTENSAAFQAEQVARADGDSANASSISTVQTTVSGHTTSIQTNLNSINGIYGKYSVKIDNNGYVTGFGLISEDNDGNPVSEFILLVDKFKIVTPGKNPQTPFVLGQIDGVNTVGIDGNMVIDGTLESPSIASDAIKSSHIDTNEVFVGMTIQSSNFVSGSQGWRIDQNGDLEIYGGSIEVGPGSSGYANLSDAPQQSSLLNNRYDFEDGAKGFWGGSVVDVTGELWHKALRSTSRDITEALSISVTPGETIYVSGVINAENANATVGLGFVEYDSGGSVLGWRRVCYVAAGTTGWVYVSGHSVIQADGVSIRPWMQINAYSAFGEALVTKITFTRHALGADVTDYDAIEVAYENYANAQIALEQTRADAYADGVADAAEIAAINAAQSKADAAETAAMAYADGIVTSSEQAAIDAANAYADAQDVVYETTVKAYADGIVTAEEARAIQDATDKAEAARIAAESAAAIDAQAKVDAVEVGGRNLLQDSAEQRLIPQNSTATNVGHIDCSKDDQFAISGLIKLASLVSASSQQTFLIQEYNDNDERIFVKWVSFDLTDVYQRHSYVYTVQSVSVSYLVLGIRSTNSDPNGTYYKEIKFEKGNKATDWTLAPEDVESAYTAYADAVTAAEQVRADAYADGVATVAEQAAIDAAQVKADAAETTAKAYADGIVSTSEQAAIDAANNYADAQDLVYETITKAYADGIVSDEEARAIQDATNKAEAARVAAVDAAFADATNKANAAEANANLYADTKAVVYYQAGEPASPNVGDIWKDTDDPANTVRRYNGATWDVIATEGATWGIDLIGQPSDSDIYNSYNLIPTNILPGSAFKNADDWDLYLTYPGEYTQFVCIANVQGLSLEGESTGYIGQNLNSSYDPATHYAEISSNYVLATENQRFCLSVYLASVRCSGQIFISFFDADKTYIPASNFTYTQSEIDASDGFAGGSHIDGYLRCTVFATAPTGTKYLQVKIRKYVSDTIGDSSYLYSVRAQLSEALENQTVPPPYVPYGTEGATWGVDITDQPLLGELAGLDKINNTVIDDHSIAAQKIYATSLSTLSANIGVATAGRVQSSDNHRYVNLSATGDDHFLHCSDSDGEGVFYITADGDGFIKRSFVSDLTVQTYTYPGTYSLVIPAGTSSIEITVVGGGGGGAGGWGGGSSSSATYKGGDGGSPGAILTATRVPNINGETITIHVGAGGAGGTNILNIVESSDYGSAGGTSYVSSPGGNFVTVSAVGGAGGSVNAVPYDWQNQHLAVNGANSASYSGGVGGLTYLYRPGGNGGDASIMGAGGNGGCGQGVYCSKDGQPGQGPGAGGGGGGVYHGSASSVGGFGGAGASGYVEVKY